MISGYRVSHAARAWKARDTYKRLVSIRVEERVDQLKTIRATILKELDKTKTLNQLQELKNYRDPSRSVITVINAILLIIREERCGFRHPPLLLLIIHGIDELLPPRGVFFTQLQCCLI